MNMKVVYTCGVFDILHIGHINLLFRAKALGDYLVVGIQEDRWVMKRKEKPVLSTAERVRQLKALGFADKVISYSGLNTTPEILKRIKPDVFLHGEDWEQQGDRTRIKEYMKKNNIELILLPRTEGISSTDIKIRITKKNGEKKVRHPKRIDYKENRQKYSNSKFLK